MTSVATVKHARERAQAQQPADENEMTTALPDAVGASLRDVLGPAGYITDATRLEPHLTEWRGLFRGEAAALLLPDSTESAAAAVSICASNGIAMVPQGGNTGLVGGAIPHRHS